MRKMLLAVTAIAALTAPQLARAAIIEDPLHGLACTGTTCVNTDNSSFAPFTGTSFGFTISPGPATGTLDLVVGVPTNEINTGTFNLPGLTDNGGGLTTTPFSRLNLFSAASAGGTGILSTYLGLGSFSPTDNFSNLSAGTLANDPGFDGNFLVFSVSIPNFTIDQNCSPCSLTNQFNFASLLPGGSFVTGLFNEVTGPEAGNNIGTAASGHLVQTVAVPGPIVGAGLPGLLSALLGMVGLNRYRRRRVA